MKASAVIPSYQPDEKLTRTVRGIIAAGFTDIIVVDDGSSPEHQAPFDEVAALPEVTLLRHEVNRGKGRALKTAFEFCLEHRPDISGVVTADGDGQHTPADILACAERLEELRDSVVLGCRDFSRENVPFKSRAGNNITRTVFLVACGIRISDTQTGLRAVPARYFELMTEIRGERYEYETEMLLELRRRSVPMAEVTIDTVYIDDNAASHFHPFRDSFRIYRMILGYIASSLASTGVDLLVFTLLVLLLGADSERSARLLIATAVARIVSSLVNYSLNRKLVFGSKRSASSTLPRYYLLCVCQLAASYGLVLLASSLLDAAGFLETLIKIVIDCALFLISFRIQNQWVFADAAEKETNGI